MVASRFPVPSRYRAYRSFFAPAITCHCAIADARHCGTVEVSDALAALKRGAVTSSCSNLPEGNRVSALALLVGRSLTLPRRRSSFSCIVVCHLVTLPVILLAVGL